MTEHPLHPYLILGLLALLLGLTACNDESHEMGPRPESSFQLPASTDVTLMFSDTVFTDLHIPTVTIEGHDTTLTKTLIGKEGETMEHTVIVYMAAENSMSSYVQSDVYEMAQSLNIIPADSRVVLFIDDQRSSRIGVATRGCPFLPVHLFEENINAVDSAAMERVLTTITTRYPARHYSLILWSHASGWVFHHAKSSTNAWQAPLKSFGIDNGRRESSNTGQQMNITTLAHVLGHYPRLEYILFDACFMQCVEVAYELRHATSFVIASAAEIPGDGAPYHTLLPTMCQVPCAAEEIIDHYYNYYTEGNGAMTYHGVQLAVTASEQMQTLADATCPLVQKLFANRTVVNCDGVQHYNPEHMSSTYTDFYDMQHLFYKASQRGDITLEEYEQWLQAFDLATPYLLLSEEWYSILGSRYQHFETMSDPEHCGGVSIFVPNTRYEQKGWVKDYHALEWYTASGLAETGW